RSSPAAVCLGAAWPVAMLALFAASQRLKPRPDLATVVLPVVLLLFLDALRLESVRRGRGAALARIFFTVALWTKAHGSFVLGPGMALAFACGTWVQRRHCSPWMWGAAGASIAATLVNPRGPAVWSLLKPYFRIFGGPAGAATQLGIQEWTPTF